MNSAYTFQALFRKQREHCTRLVTQNTLRQNLFFLVFFLAFFYLTIHFRNRVKCAGIQPFLIAMIANGGQSKRTLRIVVIADLF